MEDKIESSSLEVKIAVGRPVASGVDALRFSVFLQKPDGESLMEITGWRVRGGRVQPPSTLFKKRYLNIVFVSSKVEELLADMVGEWATAHQGVEFPKGSIQPRQEAADGS